MVGMEISVRYFYRAAAEEREYSSEEVHLLPATVFGTPLRLAARHIWRLVRGDNRGAVCYGSALGVPALSSAGVDRVQLEVLRGGGLSLRAAAGGRGPGDRGDGPDRAGRVSMSALWCFRRALREMRETSFGPVKSTSHSLPHLLTNGYSRSLWRVLCTVARVAHVTDWTPQPAPQRREPWYVHLVGALARKAGAPASPARARTAPELAMDRQVVDASYISHRSLHGTCNLIMNSRFWRNHCVEASKRRTRLWRSAPDRSRRDDAPVRSRP